MFVKSAGRYDELDKTIYIWRIFLEVFGGSATQPAFDLVVTKCANPANWGHENKRRPAAAGPRLSEQVRFRERPGRGRGGLRHGGAAGGEARAVAVGAGHHAGRVLKRKVFPSFHMLYASEDDAQLRDRSQRLFELVLQITQDAASLNLPEALFAAFRLLHRDE